MPWIRIIEPEIEIKTLSQREALTGEQLAAQQFRCPLENEHVANFTPASAFHFFTNGVRQWFYRSKETLFGIIIYRTLENRSVMFRKSMDCVISDEIFKKPLEEAEFEKIMANNHFVRTNEKDASGMVKQNFLNLVEKYKRDGRDPGEAKIPWTEGLFRHKFSDIDGILIHKNEDSFRKGYAFAKVIEGITHKKLQFCTWDEKELKLMDREEIKKALGFGKDESNPLKQTIDDKTKSTINEYKAYLPQA
jgi:hypothetical protein